MHACTTNALSKTPTKFSQSVIESYTTKHNKTSLIFFTATAVFVHVQHNMYFRKCALQPSLEST